MNFYFVLIHPNFFLGCDVLVFLRFSHTLSLTRNIGPRFRVWLAESSTTCRAEAITAAACSCAFLVRSINLFALLVDGDYKISAFMLI